MLYWIFYFLMLLGYSGLSILAPDFKSRLIGILLTFANAVIFWKS